MANSEYLNILKQGVQAWNNWVGGSGGKLRFGPPADLSKLDGSFLREFDMDRFRFEYNPAPSEMREMYEYYANGTFPPYLRSYGWKNLNNVNFALVDLSGADLEGIHLKGANLIHTNLSYANLKGADLTGARLWEANLTGAELDSANLERTDFHRAVLKKATLTKADLRRANLTGADFTGTILAGSDLQGSIMVDTIFQNADLSSSKIYGVSAWNLLLKGAKQNELIITPHFEKTISVDNLEVAQFIYLLLKNDKIRDVIDTITSKAVLILGRFTEKRKKVLDALRDNLRQKEYLPILFDFEKPSSRDLTETISTLAHMSRFIVADLTEAKSIPQELQRIIPDLPNVPVQPILLKGESEYAMFEHFRHYPWVLKTYIYSDTENLINSLLTKVIEPAESKILEIRKKE